MMKLKINDLMHFSGEREVFNTDASPDFIAIVGANSAGKSSALAAFSACASGTDNPLNLPRNKLKKYIHDDGRTGHAELIVGDQSYCWFPGQKTPENTESLSSPASCGMVDLLSGSPKARQEDWRSILKTKPTGDALLNAVDSDIGEAAAMLDEVGIEETLQHYQGRMRDAKRTYQRLTGEAYGAGKANKFIKGWRIDLTGVTIAEAQAAIDNAQGNIMLAMGGDDLKCPSCTANLVATVDDPDEVEKRRNDLRLVERQGQVHAVVKEIAAIAKVIDALEPTGVFRSALLRELSEVRQHLGKVIKAAGEGWEGVSIDDDFNVSWNGRPIALCAENERWKAQASLQFAVAIYNGDKFVTLDGADVLKHESEEGLFRVCAWAQQKHSVIAVVAGTLLEFNSDYNALEVLLK